MDRDQSRRMLVVGNSGSGKSYVARRVSEALGLHCVHLDQIFWKPGGCSEKRPVDEVLTELDRIRAGRSWVVEGTFGDLVERCIPDATDFIFLDLTPEECEKNLRTRGFEPEKWADPELGRSKFEGLIAWAKDYRNRTDRFSRPFHSRLYESFERNRLHFKSSAEVTAWLARYV
jgi:adenylate kinase family enzyme